MHFYTELDGEMDREIDKGREKVRNRERERKREVDIEKERESHFAIAHARLLLARLSAERNLEEELN